jgi:ferrochelatase
MPRDGVLLVNLGSPDSTSVSDVRRYLREFLMDPRVIDVPLPVRFAIVHGAVLPFRPHVSAEAYVKVWTDEGSPLIAISRRLQGALQERTGVPVELAMRYQNPSIASALLALRQSEIERVRVVPLFPHYAMSSYESAVERVKQVAAKIAPALALDIVPPYYDRPEYIEALVEVAAPALETEYDHFLFSFHGVPERHIRKTDATGSHCLQAAHCCEGIATPHATCYRHQCFITARRFADAAGLSEGRFSVSFQSRLGRDKWLSPASQDEMVRMAGAGVRKLVVMCPAFTVDCLETLEEIGIRGRAAFLAAGGAELTLIPCLNDHPAWVNALCGMLGTRGGAGVGTQPAYDRQAGASPAVWSTRRRRGRLEA